MSLDVKAKKNADGELLVMARLNRQLEALDPVARRRVLNWLSERHLSPLRPAAEGGTGGGCNAPRLGT